MPFPKDAWIQVTVACAEIQVDAVSNFLTEIGAQGVYQEFPAPADEIEAAFQPPTGRQTVQAFFPSDVRMDTHLKSLKTYLANLEDLFPDEAPPTFSAAPLGDENWAEEWKKYFKPLQVTKSIIIKPTWERYTPVGHEIVIDVDPGMAFGTGQHPSTRMCLEIIEDLMLHDRRGRAWQVLDVGTGTGILGIAAAKFGAEQVVCIDIDRQATDIAKVNAAVNGVADRLDISSRDVATLHGAYDIVIANLTAKTLLPLRNRFIALLKEGGKLILSGIVEPSRADIEAAFLTPPFAPVRVLAEKEWLCYLLSYEGFPR